MAEPPSSGAILPHRLKLSQTTQRSKSDSDLTAPPLQNSPHGSDLRSQFKRVHHKVLQNTSDTITEKLTQEIRKVGHRTSILEEIVDKLHNIVINHAEEMESLREENASLQARLKVFENRARRSKLHMRGILEAIEGLHSTITVLFQELAPSIPFNPHRVFINRQDP